MELIDDDVQLRAGPGDVGVDTRVLGRRPNVSPGVPATGLVIELHPGAATRLMFAADDGGVCHPDAGANAPGVAVAFFDDVGEPGASDVNAGVDNAEEIRAFGASEERVVRCLKTAGAATVAFDVAVLDEPPDHVAEPDGCGGAAFVRDSEVSDSGAILASGVAELEDGQIDGIHGSWPETQFIYKYPSPFNWS